MVRAKSIPYKRDSRGNIIINSTPSSNSNNTVASGSTNQSKSSINHINSSKVKKGNPNIQRKNVRLFDSNMSMYVFMRLKPGLI